MGLWRTIQLGALAAGVLVAAVCAAPAARSETCEVLMLPGTHGLNTPVAQGMIKSMPDGYIWFGEGTTIARVAATPPHAIDKFPIGTPAGVTNDIAAGPDGNYWFTEIVGNKIGRINPQAPDEILEIPLPVGASQPDSIVAGPDGHLWFTQWSGQIGRISPAEPYAIDQYPVPQGGVPREMVVGRNGVLWYANPATNSIGRITPQQNSAPLIREFPVPTDNARPVGLAEGRDGTIWFTEFIGGQIGWFNASTPELMTEFALPSRSSAPVDIALGPDGDLWISETGSDQIGRLRPSGSSQPPTITECSVPETPWFLDAGKDGAIWFTTFHNPGIQIGRISPEVAATGAPATGGAADDPSGESPSSRSSPGGRLAATGLTTQGRATIVSLAAVGLLLLRRRIQGRQSSVRLPDCRQEG